MYTHAFRDAILNTMDGASLSAWTPWISLITAITDMRAGTVTEASFTGYGRVSASMGAPANTSPVGGRQKANDALVTFGTNTSGSAVDVIGYGYNTASTAGTLYIVNLLDDDPPVYGVALTDDVITSPAHGLADTQRVWVLAAPGALLPVGLAENTAYYVRDSAANTFKVAATSGGTAIDITAGGAAMFIPHKPRTIADGAAAEFAIGALVEQL
jgi:hypothetical protein